jgi:hypothetical protein
VFYSTILYFDPVHFFAGLFEMAKLVLFYLWTWFLMAYYKRSTGPAPAIVGISLSGGAAVFLLLIGVVLKAITSSTGGMSQTAGQIMMWVFFFLNTGAIVACYVYLLLHNLNLKTFLDYQKPK